MAKAEKSAGSAGKKKPEFGTGDDAPTLQGVARALRLMQLLAEKPMRATVAAETLGVSWATLHRTLTQLVDDEFIEKDATGTLRIGRRTWLLGSTYLVGHRLLDLAMPLIPQAVELSPKTVFQLVERSEGTAVVLYSHEAKSGEMITRTTYGHNFPLHTGSKGLVLLAFSTPEFIDSYLQKELIALTSNTITDADLVRKELEKIRLQGYARTMGDVQPFTGSISAPIFDANGEVIAAFCGIVGRAMLDEGPQEAALIDNVTRLAQSLSLGMGWTPMRNPRYS